MGEPIRIVDLAKNLIRLSGLEPNVDIELVFTGLRPGEKLVEELRLQDERLKPTAHKRLRVLEGNRPPFQTVQAWLDDLSHLVESNNVNALVQKLTEIIPEYTPSSDIRVRCDVDKHDFAARYRRERNTLSLDALAS
jgi:FlaA1/EpsC-like NDP-sugar epimerase